MYLTDHDGQVLAELRALISSSLQLIYQLRFNHDPPCAKTAFETLHSCHTCSKVANRASKSQWLS